MSTDILLLTLSFVVILSVFNLHQRKTNLYDDAGNLGCWALNVSVGVFAVSVMTPIYHFFFYQRQWTELPDSLLTNILAILLYDFLYYWFHRASHWLRPLWNVHSVHHQAKKLVPSLGLRSSAFDFAVLWLITGPMLWLGFGRDALIIAIAVHGFYQIFLHNEFQFRFGLLEWIFNTPTHHSVHHAVNAEYLDKNFGSILIIWDRLFGTFAVKRAKPVIDVTGINAVKNPLFSNFGPWLGIQNDSIEVSSNTRISTTLLNLVAFFFALAGMFGYVSSELMLAGVLTSLIILVFLVKMESLRA